MEDLWQRLSQVTSSNLSRTGRERHVRDFLCQGGSPSGGESDVREVGVGSMKWQGKGVNEGNDPLGKTARTGKK